MCLLVPLAIFGALFAGVVLWRRGLPQHGVGVVALALACMAFGVTVLW